MTFSTYYQRELDYLLEMGRAYGARHHHARHLAQRSHNPYAERILEGVAFLTAKLHERIDGAFPEMVEPMLEMLAPQLLAPLPSCTIMEFLPSLSACRAIKTLPAGTQVGSSADPDEDRPQCLFQTTHPVRILPVQVLGASLTSQGSTRKRLRIDLQTHVAGRLALAQAGGIELFVHGESQFTGALLLALDRHCEAIQVVQGPSDEKVCALDPRQLRLCAFDAQRHLLPWGQHQALRSHRAIAEFLVLPQAFSFFEVRGLDQLDLSCDEFSLLFDLESAPTIPGNVGEDTFHLHCVPAINLFEAPSEPLLMSALGGPREIRAVGHGPFDVEVYDVQDVSTQPEGGGASEAVPSFFSQTVGEDQALRYALRRRVSPVDEGMDTAFEFVSSSTRPLGDQVVSMNLRCTHRHHPAKLRVGDICEQPHRGHRVPYAFRNLVLPTTPLRARMGDQLQWRLASMMSLRRCNVHRIEEVQALFDLYEDIGRAPGQRGQGSVSARTITQLVSRAQVQPVQGEIWSGTQVQLGLDANTIGIGPSYLLACLLNEVLAGYVPLNAFHQMQVRCADPASSTPARWEFGRRFAAREVL